jgi:AsmA protein
MKVIKRIIALILSLLILASVLLVGLALVVDFNQYKALIAAQVEQATGRQLEISGDIKVSLWPWLGVQVEGVELSNAAGFGDQPFARVDKFGFKLALLPLLQKQINIDKILVYGLSLSLHKNAQGQSNWDDLIRSRPAQPQVASPDVVDQSAPGLALGDISIQGIEISRSSLHWHDKQSQTQFSLQAISLQTGAIALDRSIPLSFSAQAQLAAPQVGIQLSGATEINMNMASMQLALNELSLQLRVLTPHMVAQNTQIQLTAAVHANLTAQQYKINNLQVKLNAKGYKLPAGELAFTLNSSAVIDMQQQTLVVEALQVAANGVRLTASAKVSQLIDNPVIEGELKLAEFNPMKVARAYNIALPAMASATALQKIQAQLRYRFTENHLALNDLLLTLDASVISGSLAVKNFSSPALQYDLTLNTLNLDDYLPAVNQPSQRRASRAPGLSNAPLNLPLASLRKLNIDGVFRVGSMVVQGVQLDKLYLKMRGQKGLLVANPINARLFDGRVAIAARLDVRSKQARYSFNVKAQSLQLEAAAKPILLHLLNAKEASLTGQVDVNLALHTQGDSVRALVAGLNGQVDFSAGKTQLKDVDIEYYLRQRVWFVLDQKIRKADKRLISLLRKNNFPTTEKEFSRDYRRRDKTAFNVLRARARIKQGVVNNYDFLMVSDRVTVTGKGHIDLHRQQMDYAAKIDLHRSHNTLQDQLLDIPLRVSFNGPFAALKPRPDVSDWLHNAWPVVTSSSKKEVKEKIKQQAKDKFKSILKQWQF